MSTITRRVRGRKSGTLAFSLTEILAAVAIIAILAGLLYGVFGAVREKARTSSCASNLHQIGLALAMYETDWDGQAPRDGIIQDNPPHRLAWDLLSKYTKSRDVFSCPDANAPRDLIGYVYRAGPTIITEKDRHPLRLSPETVVAYCMDHLQRTQIPAHPELDNYAQDAQGHYIGRFNALREDTSALNVNAKQVDEYAYDGKEWILRREVPKGVVTLGIIARFPGEPWPPEFQP